MAIAKALECTLAELEADHSAKPIVSAIPLDQLEAIKQAVRDELKAAPTEDPTIARIVSKLRKLEPEMLKQISESIELIVDRAIKKQIK